MMNKMNVVNAFSKQCSFVSINLDTSSISVSINLDTSSISVSINLDTSSISVSTYQSRYNLRRTPTRTTQSVLPRYRLLQNYPLPQYTWMVSIQLQPLQNLWSAAISPRYRMIQNYPFPQYTWFISIQTQPLQTLQYKAISPRCRLIQNSLILSIYSVSINLDTTSECIAQVLGTNCRRTAWPTIIPWDVSIWILYSLYFTSLCLLTKKQLRSVLFSTQGWITPTP